MAELDPGGRAPVTRYYRDVVLEVTGDDSRMELVAAGFDAGIHFGEYIQKDMIAVRVSKDHRAAIVAELLAQSRAGMVWLPMMNSNSD